MSIVTFEGVVENGQIRLDTNVRLPEKAKVYVVVPDLASKPAVHIFTPRLAHKAQATDFKKELVEGSPQ